MIGVRVERTKAEALRKELSSSGLVDKTHAIVDDDGHVVMPLLAKPDELLLSKYCASLVDSSFPERHSREDPIDEVRRLAQVPSDLKALLPDKWEHLGDVLVLRFDPALDRFEVQAAEAYARALGVKTVLRDLGGVTGEYRRPVTKLLFGSETVTVHKENGILFKFDAAEIMFSSGNMEERIRMAGTPCDGEIIIDMFAGIGYFSLPLAVYQRPRRILACEINPVAHRYLVDNVGLNNAEGIIEPRLGDNRTLEGEGYADRIIMGYVRTTHEFLPDALRLLKDGGIIHYHETCPNELLPTRPIKHLVDSAAGGTVKVLRFKEIKSYAPGVSHVVVDARVAKPV